MLKRLFVVALALFTFGCAPMVPGLRTNGAKPAVVAPTASPVKINFPWDDADMPKPKPVVKCDPDKAACVVKHKLNAEVGDKSVAAAIDMIDAAEEAGADAFVLEINTPGGSVPDGFELSKRIEDATIPITCVVDGDAASMGFYILQSCPERLMTKRSTLMAHEPALGGMFRGQPNEWAAIAAMMAAMRDALAEHCNHRLSSTIGYYHYRTDGGKMWWFNWNDALHWKAVDGVVGSVAEVVKGLGG
jgi:ATP-dependent protease ClpP protease subunit